MIDELIKKNRSYRRFNAERAVTDSELRRMVENARCSASAANLQRIRYTLIKDKDMCDKVFPHLSFAGYLKEWGGPLPTERPTAYIVLMTEKTPDVALSIDIGIAAQSILLTATEMGLGGCMFRSFKREELDTLLNKEGYSAELVIALGEPSEKVYLVAAVSGEIKYYRDENDNHAVPKLSLDEIII